jgi:hypothetical protein
MRWQVTPYSYLLLVAAAISAVLVFTPGGVGAQPARKRWRCSWLACVYGLRGTLSS